MSCEALREADDYIEADCLAKIAAVLLRMGERGEALATWLSAARLAQQHQWHMDSVKVLVRIATALLDIGETGRAVEVAEMIREAEARDRALRDVAMRTRDGAPRNDEERYRFLALQAKEAAEAGRPTEARDLLRQIPSRQGSTGWVDSKIYALLAVASKLNEPGTLREAAEMAREARLCWETMQGGAECRAPGYLIRIGQLLVRAGARDDAIALWNAAARRAEARQHAIDGCGWMLALLARSFAEIGERDRAVDVATSIEDDVTRSSILRQLMGPPPSLNGWPPDL